MAIYARIENNVVVEFPSVLEGFTIDQCYPASFVAQCVDVTNITPAPLVGDTATETAGVWSFAAPVAPTLTPAEIAATAYATAITTGLTVTSTSTPALNGVYPIDADSQAEIGVEAQFISTFAEFTNGSTTNLQWPLRDGVTLVTFPTTAAFLAFAKVAGQTVAAAKLALAQAAAMPSFAVEIP